MVSGGFAMPSITGRNQAQSYYNTIDSLEHVAGRLRGVTIECLPYDEVIRRYDSETTLFYCDPPYHNAKHYYGNSFTENSHCRLAELLHSIKKARQCYLTTGIAFMGVYMPILTGTNTSLSRVVISQPVKQNLLP